MYSVSPEFLTAMDSPVQEHKVTGTIGSATFGPANILAGSFSINAKLCSEQEIQIGQVYIAELSATFRNVSVNPGEWQGKVITPIFSLKTENGWEDVPLGVFTVQEATISASGVTVKAYDNMAKFDKYCTTYRGAGGGAGVEGATSVVVGRTTYDMIMMICRKVGVDFGMTRMEVAALPNSGNGWDLFSDNDITTYRDMLSWMAQTLACNATINREGKLVLVPFKSASDYTFDDEHRHEGASFKDFTTRITEIWLDCKPMEKSYSYHVTPNNGLPYELGQNPYLQIGTAEDRDDAMNDILTALQEVNYTPFDVNLTGCPIFDLGDVLTFTGGITGGLKKGAVTSFTYTYNAAYKLACGGKNPAEAKSKSATDKRMDGINSSVTSQGKQVMVVRNAESVTLGDGSEVTVIDYPFEVTDSVNLTIVSTEIIMTTEATETETGDVFTIGDIVARAILYLDDIEIGDLYPEFIVDEGTDTINFDYSLKNLTVGAHNYTVKLELNGGDGEISENDVHESLWGYGITFEVYLKYVQVVSGKNRFFIGDLLDTSDWNVRGVNNNGTTISPLTGWTTDPANGTELDEEGTISVDVLYEDVSGSYDIEVIVPPTLTFEYVTLRKTDGFDYDFTSDIFYEPDNGYVVLSNVPDSMTGQVLANKQPYDPMYGYSYIPYHDTHGPVAFMTDASQSSKQQMAFFTHPYYYNGNWRRSQYWVYDHTTDPDSPNIMEAGADLVGNMINLQTFNYVGIVPNDLAISSTGITFIALSETKVITQSGVTYNIPYFWHWDGLSSFAIYIWAVQGQSGLYYSAFAFDKYDNDRLFAIKQSGTSLQVVEVDYSEITTNLTNAESYDFLTVLNTYQSLSGNYNITLHERMYAANGLVAWVIADEDSNIRTLYILNTTSGVVRAIASVERSDLAFGGFDYCADLGMWLALFGSNGYASTDGATWTEVKLERDGGGAVHLHGNNFVLDGSKIYISNSGLYAGDLADIDL